MSRIAVTLRAATPDDASALADLWAEVLRRGDGERRLGDVRAIMARAAEDPDQRVVVAEYDGRLAGAVLLEVTTVTPLDLEPVVRAVSPHVLPEFRRHGVGSALIDAAVRFAEERGVGHLVSAAVADSRDANRFMARLALTPLATLRIAPTATVRARLSTIRPAYARQGNRSFDRQIDKVLAARRIRRSERVTG